MISSIVILAGSIHQNNQQKQDNLNKCNLLVKAYNISNIDCNEFASNCFDILTKVPVAFQNKPFNCIEF